MLASQAGFPGLRYAMVIQPNGRVMAHTESGRVGAYLQDAVSRSLFSGAPGRRLLVADRNLIDTAQPILANGRLIAWARVGISQEAVTRGLRVITRDGIVYTLLAILIGTLFAVFMARGLTAGLQKLVGVAEGIRQGGAICARPRTAATKSAE